MSELQKLRSKIVLNVEWEKQRIYNLIRSGFSRAVERSGTFKGKCLGLKRRDGPS